MAEGLTTIPGKGTVEEIAAKLEGELRARSITLFARIDHAAGAAEAGLSLRPTILLIFGNAKSGTPLMQAAQTIGIDLPLKLLVWQDESGATQISYNQPAWLAQRHGVDMANVTSAVEALISGMIKAVVG